MGVPKGRRTKSKQGHRRSHLSLKKMYLSKCPKCGTMIKPHQACYNCGEYRGRQTVDVLAKLTKRERKERQKELDAAQEQSMETDPTKLSQK